jgi:hypothetical protein
MDNLVLANGVPPEKLNSEGFTPGYPASRSNSEANNPPIPTNPQKMAGLPSESLDDLARNQWTDWVGTGGRFGSESVVRLARNTQLGCGLG